MSTAADKIPVSATAAPCRMTTVRLSGLSSSTTPLAAKVLAFVSVVSEGKGNSAAVALNITSKPPNNVLANVGHNFMFKNQA